MSIRVEYLAFWLSRYLYDRPWVDVEANAAFRASEARWLRSIAQDRTPSQEGLVELVRWKFGWPAARRRPMQSIKDHWPATCSTIEEAVRTAEGNPQDDATPMGMLDEIPGFGVPMASAVLAVWFPDRYPVVDRRALSTIRALGEPTMCDDLAKGSAVQRVHWEPYLAACRALLAECTASGIPAPGQVQWTLRAIDRALWSANGVQGPFHEFR